MTPPAETSPDIAQAAAEWVIRRDRGLSVREQAEFARWHAADTRHREEFDRIAAGWRDLDRLAPAPMLSAAADAVVLRARNRRSRRRVTVMTGGIFAAAVALALGFFAWLRPVPAPVDNYKVIASSSREVRLPDGSVALLNGNSRIETHYTPGERRIRLIQGEALFTVAKNPARPFHVTAGPITVRAVGTAFNVRMGAAAVEVLVTEGRVRVDESMSGRSLLKAGPESDPTTGSPDSSSPVSEPVLTAGQRVVVNLAAVVDDSSEVAVVEVGSAEIEQSLAWQSTRLVFNDTPLDEVVGIFNRYNRHRLVMGDRGLAGRKITGVFSADNPDGFARLLEATADVRTEQNGNGDTVLRSGR